MKKIQNSILIATLALASCLAGCNKDYLNVNSDPNRTTDDNITPDLIFTQAATNVAMRHIGASPGSEGSTIDLQFAQDWVGYMSNTGDFALPQIESSYNIDFAFGDNAWQRDYGTLFDLYQAKTKALANGNKVLAGAAMILSAKLFQDVVDTYGDVPYSQAFQTNVYKHPVYDKAQDIYNDLQLSLDSAIIYMDEDAPASFATVDVVNHGDQTKWQKFANTLKLRLLIRQSEVPGFNPATEIAKIEAKGGVLGAGESVSVNPGFSNAQYKQSPFYGNYGFTTTGNKAATGYAPNNYILNILGSTNDPRIERFFTTVGGFYVGCDYGLITGNPFGAQASYFGEGIAKSGDQDQWLIPSFESMFFEAEAIARGWMPGDARTAFEAAITESFVWLGVEDAETAAADYIANTDIANWDNAGETAEDQAKFIALQKYIAITCIDAREAWADQRRLHFLPEGFITFNPSRLADELPLRLLYPQSEYTTNAESVQAVGTINQFTTKIFWEP
ncbi:SusD/RagB family nutrient-binding outer membrane lipoprotein [Panacibacter ginsenosidivorans]|uniref:SusD/RagB family nutrient-binding outer membrane lipoprotein n=1 Tax=Panacibacter ginsenosidivorans TaxID=1813871 RepID=A0A5B8VFY4_9BACT|nr:SusD/RagB family nutrient-binding outer membrane lipoprotein [Panacibacter ginsenosidivorans]QEC70053.1 SusD/RagB family nutrient-binding outer membrane lipoprotein [Panacibacter ginsenosidivorans]